MTQKMLSYSFQLARTSPKVILSIYDIVVNTNRLLLFFDCKLLDEVDEGSQNDYGRGLRSAEAKAC